jgi:4-hydroxybenzoate polyprenyltransferase
MDKYLVVVLIFLIAGMGIAITKQPPVLPLFYAMLGGAIIVILYSSRKNRKDHNKERKLKK